MNKRITALIRTKELTASEFARTIGVQPSSISHVLSGRNKPSLDFIIRVLKTYPDINPDWLLFGQGPMAKEVTREDQMKTNGAVLTTDSTDTIKTPVPSTGEALTEKNEMTAEKGKNHDVSSDHYPVKKTIRIAIFYSDHTFTEYLPEQP
jgi:transcriptional regulator with XRE-family HTH domain